MGNQQDEVYGRGAFQLYGSELQVKISDLLADVFGRDDLTCWAGDWRGILYFTLDDEDGVLAARSASELERRGYWRARVQ